MISFTAKYKLFLMAAFLPALCLSQVASRPSHPSSSTDTANILRKRADAAFTTGRLDAAISDYGKAIGLNPHDAASYAGRARTYSAMNDYKHTFADCNRALQLDPHCQKAYYVRGTAYLKLRQNRPALADLNRAVRLDLTDMKALSNRGCVLDDMGDRKAAMVDLTEVIRLRPKDPAAYHNRGTVYYEKGDFHRALTDLDMALQLAPNYAIAHYYRGLCYSKMRMPDKCLKEYEQAITDHLQDTDECYVIATALATAGRQGTAARAYQLYLSTASPNDTQRIAKARSALQAITGKQ